MDVDSLHLDPKWKSVILFKPKKTSYIVMIELHKPSVVLVCDGTSTISYSMFFKDILKF